MWEDFVVAVDFAVVAVDFAVVAVDFAVAMDSDLSMLGTCLGRLLSTFSIEGGG